jgi:hypothetical protein
MGGGESGISMIVYWKIPKDHGSLVLFFFGIPL